MSTAPIQRYAVRDCSYQQECAEFKGTLSSSTFSNLGLMTLVYQPRMIGIICLEYNTGHRIELNSEGVYSEQAVTASIII